jgi:hypothetical protein
MIVIRRATSGYFPENVAGVAAGKAMYQQTVTSISYGQARIAVAEPTPVPGHWTMAKPSAPLAAASQHSRDLCGIHLTASLTQPMHDGHRAERQGVVQKDAQAVVRHIPAA